MDEPVCYMYKIKKDTFRKRYEILQEGTPILSVPINQFVELANTITQYVVGKDYIISAPNIEARAKGYGKYHYFKGILLAGWHDIKKKYGRKGKNG